MGEVTRIAWTDSTYSHWHGCTKVAGALACANCYAAAVNKRGGFSNWGLGAPRRLLSENSRNEIHRWNRKAAQFALEHGRRRRVFCSSMGDAFDNEVEKPWRDALYADLEAATEIDIQVLTKRLPNVPKMVPEHWKGAWPRHIGLMITVVTQAEADRDCDRLRAIKRQFNIPWVGISYEPAMEAIDFSRWLGIMPVMTTQISGLDGIKIGESRFSWERSYNVVTREPAKPDIDWIIYGGESGAGWRTFDGFFDAARQTRDQCAAGGVAFFMKQVAAFRPTDDMIPEDLRIRQWPEAWT